MKSKLIKTLAAATVTLGSSVYAQEATPDTWMGRAQQGAEGRSFDTTQRTRDEVRQEFFQARAAGELLPTGEAGTIQSDRRPGAQGRSFSAQTGMSREEFRAREAEEFRQMRTKGYVWNQYLGAYQFVGKPK
jgi:hypothetical protein